MNKKKIITRIIAVLQFIFILGTSLGLENIQVYAASSADDVKSISTSKSSSYSIKDDVTGTTIITGNSSVSSTVSTTGFQNTDRGTIVLDTNISSTNTKSVGSIKYKSVNATVILSYTEAATDQDGFSSFLDSFSQALYERTSPFDSKLCIMVVDDRPTQVKQRFHGDYGYETDQTNSVGGRTTNVTYYYDGTVASFRDTLNDVNNWTLAFSKKDGSSSVVSRDILIANQVNTHTGNTYPYCSSFSYSYGDLAYKWPLTQAKSKGYKTYLISSLNYRQKITWQDITTSRQEYNSTNYEIAYKITGVDTAGDYDHRIIGDKNGKFSSGMYSFNRTQDSKINELNLLISSINKVQTIYLNDTSGKVNELVNDQLVYGNYKISRENILPSYSNTTYFNNRCTINYDNTIGSGDKSSSINKSINTILNDSSTYKDMVIKNVSFKNLITVNLNTSDVVLTNSTFSPIGGEYFSTNSSSAKAYVKINSDKLLTTVDGWTYTITKTSNACVYIDYDIFDSSSHLINTCSKRVCSSDFAKNIKLFNINLPHAARIHKIMRAGHDTLRPSNHGTTVVRSKSSNWGDDNITGWIQTTYNGNDSWYKATWQDIDKGIVRLDYQVSISNVHGINPTPFTNPRLAMLADVSVTAKNYWKPEMWCWLWTFYNNFYKQEKIRNNYESLFVLVQQAADDNDSDNNCYHLQGTPSQIWGRLQSGLQNPRGNDNYPSYNWSSTGSTSYICGLAKLDSFVDGDTSTCITGDTRQNKQGHGGIQYCRYLLHQMSGRSNKFYLFAIEPGNSEKSSMVDRNGGEHSWAYSSGGTDHLPQIYCTDTEKNEWKYDKSNKRYASGESHDGKYGWVSGSSEIREYGSTSTMVNGWGNYDIMSASTFKSYVGERNPYDSYTSDSDGTYVPWGWRNFLKDKLSNTYNPSYDHYFKSTIFVNSEIWDECDENGSNRRVLNEYNNNITEIDEHYSSTGKTFTGKKYLILKDEWQNVLKSEDAKGTQAFPDEAVYEPDKGYYFPIVNGRSFSETTTVTFGGKHTFVYPMITADEGGGGNDQGKYEDYGINLYRKKVKFTFNGNTDNIKDRVDNDSSNKGSFQQRWITKSIANPNIDKIEFKFNSSRGTYISDATAGTVTNGKDVNPNVRHEHTGETSETTASQGDFSIYGRQEIADDGTSQSNWTDGWNDKYKFTDKGKSGKDLYTRFRFLGWSEDPKSTVPDMKTWGSPWDEPVKLSVFDKNRSLSINLRRNKDVYAIYEPILKAEVRVTNLDEPSKIADLKDLSAYGSLTDSSYQSRSMLIDEQDEGLRGQLYKYEIYRGTLNSIDTDKDRLITTNFGRIVNLSKNISAYYYDKLNEKKTAQDTDECEQGSSNLNRTIKSGNEKEEREFYIPTYLAVLPEGSSYNVVPYEKGESFPVTFNISQHSYFFENYGPTGKDKQPNESIKVVVSLNTKENITVTNPPVWCYIHHIKKETFGDNEDEPYDTYAFDSKVVGSGYSFTPPTRNITGYKTPAQQAFTVKKGASNHFYYYYYPEDKVRLVVNHYLEDKTNTGRYYLQDTDSSLQPANTFVIPETKDTSTGAYKGYTAPPRVRVKIKADGTTYVNYTYKWKSDTPEIHKSVLIVKHYLENDDGTYSLYEVEPEREEPGSTYVTPAVKHYHGYISPEPVCVFINPDGTTYVNYNYKKKDNPDDPDPIPDIPPDGAANLIVRHFKQIPNQNKYNLADEENSVVAPGTRLEVPVKSYPNYTSPEPIKIEIIPNRYNVVNYYYDTVDDTLPDEPLPTDNNLIVRHFKQIPVTSGGKKEYQLAEKETFHAEADEEITPAVKDYAGYSKPSPITVKIIDKAWNQVDYYYDTGTIDPDPAYYRVEHYIETGYNTNEYTVGQIENHIGPVNSGTQVTPSRKNFGSQYVIPDPITITVLYGQDNNVKYYYRYKQDMSTSHPDVVTRIKEWSNQ